MNFSRGETMTEESFKAEVKLAVKGDTEAFAKLYELVYKELYRTALFGLRNSEDACDAVSETVLDAFSGIKNLKDENAFRKWIFRILASKIKRKQKEYINKRTEQLDEDMKGQSFDFGYTELNHEIEKLEQEERLILSLAVISGYTSNEIAEMTGLKPSTVRSKLMRTKEKLKKRLEVAGYE